MIVKGYSKRISIASRGVEKLFINIIMFTLLAAARSLFHYAYRYAKKRLSAACVALVYAIYMFNFVNGSRYSHKVAAVKYEG